MINYMYVVHFQVIPLNRLPFSSTNNIRSAYQEIFSKNCFLNNKTSIYFRNELLHFSQSPFIRNWGEVCFDTRRADFFPPRNDYQRCAHCFGNFLTSNKLYCNEDKRYNTCPSFGYLKDLKDQRMNYLNFELKKPIIVRTKVNKEEVRGKFFIHIYPSGYITIAIACRFPQSVLLNCKDMRYYVQETNPWRNLNKWIWVTDKRGEQTYLRNIYTKILEDISISLFEDKTQLKSEGAKVYTAVAIAADSSYGHIAKNLFNNDRYEIMKFDHKNDAIIFSKQGIIDFFSHKHNFISKDKKTRILHNFWKMVTIYELIALKEQVYSDYLYYLRSETNSLKIQRFKLSGFDFKLTIYDSNIRKYHAALDDVILRLPPFYRAVYKSISQVSGFDEKRKKFKEILKEWEDEVAKWEPLYMKTGDKILRLLKNLFAFLF